MQVTEKPSDGYLIIFNCNNCQRRKHLKIKTEQIDILYRNGGFRLAPVSNTNSSRTNRLSKNDLSAGNDGVLLNSTLTCSECKNKDKLGCKGKSSSSSSSSSDDQGKCYSNNVNMCLENTTTDDKISSKVSQDNAGIEVNISITPSRESCHKKCCDSLNKMISSNNAECYIPQTLNKQELSTVMKSRSESKESKLMSNLETNHSKNGSQLTQKTSSCQKVCCDYLNKIRREEVDLKKNKDSANSLKSKKKTSQSISDNKTTSSNASKENDCIDERCHKKCCSVLSNLSEKSVCKDKKVPNICVQNTCLPTKPACLQDEALISCQKCCQTLNRIRKKIRDQTSGSSVLKAPYGNLANEDILQCDLEQCHKKCCEILGQLNSAVKEIESENFQKDLENLGIKSKSNTKKSDSCHKKCCDSLRELHKIQSNNLGELVSPRLPVCSSEHCHEKCCQKMQEIKKTDKNDCSTFSRKGSPLKSVSITPSPISEVPRFFKQKTGLSIAKCSSNATKSLSQSAMHTIKSESPTNSSKSIFNQGSPVVTEITNSGGKININIEISSNSITCLKPQESREVSPGNVETKQTSSSFKDQSISPMSKTLTSSANQSSSKKYCDSGNSCNLLVYCKDETTDCVCQTSADTIDSQNDSKLHSSLLSQKQQTNNSCDVGCQANNVGIKTKADGHTNVRSRPGRTVNDNLLTDSEIQVCNDYSRQVSRTRSVKFPHRNKNVKSGSTKSVNKKASPKVLLNRNKNTPPTLCKCDSRLNSSRSLSRGSLNSSRSSGRGRSGSPFRSSRTSSRMSLINPARGYPPKHDCLRRKGSPNYISSSGSYKYSPRRRSSSTSIKRPKKHDCLNKKRVDLTCFAKPRDQASSFGLNGKKSSNLVFIKCPNHK